MIRFTEKDKTKIIKSERLSKLELSSGTYYLNGNGYHRAIGELLGEKVADLIGLKHINYHTVVIDGQIYVLSEVLENFETADDLFLADYISQQPAIPTYFDSLSLYDIWIALERKNICNEELMKDIVKMFIMDLFLLIADRRGSNWGINEENGKKEVYIFDNELCLSYETSYYMKIRADLEDKKENKLDDLEGFLGESTHEFVEIAESICKLLTPEKIKEFLDSIQKEIDPENQYKDYYEMIQGRYDRNYKKLKARIFREPIEEPLKKM